MTRMMRQMICAGPKKTKIIEVPVPSYNDDEMLVRVTLSGACHSEWFPWFTSKEGDLLGHESVGVVEEVGKNVKGFKAGDRVTGLGGGAFKEYIVVEPDKMAHVPDGLKDEDALSEPLACILSACEKLKPETIGDTVCVVGCGYMGLGAISCFKAMGYGRIIAIDKREIALENAKKFGATETYLNNEIPKEFYCNWDTMGVVDLTRNGDNSKLFALGIDTVMEFTGTPDGLELASELVKPHGRLGIGGYHNDSLRSVDYKLWNFKAFTSINCHERRIEYEAFLCKRCMELLDKGIWKFKGVTKVFNIDEFDEVCEMMIDHRDNFIKAGIKM